MDPTPRLICSLFSPYCRSLFPLVPAERPQSNGAVVAIPDVSTGTVLTDRPGSCARLAGCAGSVSSEDKDRVVPAESQ